MTLSSLEAFAILHTMYSSFACGRGLFRCRCRLTLAEGKAYTLHGQSKGGPEESPPAPFNGAQFSTLPERPALRCAFGLGLCASEILVFINFFRTWKVDCQFDCFALWFPGSFPVPISSHFPLVPARPLSSSITSLCRPSPFSFAVESS